MNKTIEICQKVSEFLENDAYMYINGEFVPSSNNVIFETFNPDNNPVYFLVSTTFYVPVSLPQYNTS